MCTSARRLHLYSVPSVVQGSQVGSDSAAAHGTQSYLPLSSSDCSLGAARVRSAPLAFVLAVLGEPRPCGRPLQRRL